MTLAVGDRVRILRKSKLLDSRTGRIEAIDSENGRYSVALDCGLTTNFMPGELEPETEES